MTKFVVLFEDDEAFAHQRAAFMSEHLAFLEEHTSHIEAAGPLSNSENASNAGGMWLVDADHADDVKHLIETDPFWSTGLRKNFRVLVWTRVFSNGQRSALPRRY